MTHRPSVALDRAHALSQWIAGLGAAGAVVALAACSPEASTGSCAEGAVLVGSSPNDLQRALDAAQPGDAIQLADATYAGHFTITADGTKDAPIALCAAGTSTLHGGDDGYTLHLDGAEYWTLEGFAVTGGAKGIMLDAASHNDLTDLEVSGTGEEGIHLRTGSSDNTISDSTVWDAGLTTPGYGEGIYVGSAESNWCEYTACSPDASNHNTLVGNTIRDVGAEAIDVKEGTTGTRIGGNTLSIGGTSDADSVVHLKGDDTVFEGNMVLAGSVVGVQVYSIAGWGAGNTLSENTFDIGDGLNAIEIVGAARELGNLVTCTNTAVGAAAGLSAASGSSIRSNVSCS